MKKILLLAISLWSTDVSTATTVTTKTYAKSSNGCSGNGICSVTTTSNGDGYITTEWTLDSDQLTLTMVIPDETISDVPEDLLAQLMAGEFVMEAAFIFPDDIAREIGAIGGIRIHAGTFSATRTSEGYSVRFTLE